MVMVMMMMMMGCFNALQLGKASLAHVICHTSGLIHLKKSSWDGLLSIKENRVAKNMSVKP